MTKKKIVVVGGGITGLTAAYYLKKDIEADRLPYEVILIEASDRLGGKIQTVHQDGFVLERGPDSFLERKKPALNLVKQLGIEDELVRNSTGQARVLVDDVLYNIPAGSYMGIPVRGTALDGSTLISEAGKQRVWEELNIPKGAAVPDQSLGQFLRRRFGDELIENLVEPLLSGIYSSDIDDMSLMASFPMFYELEQTYGSVIKGRRETLPTAQASTGKRKGQFLTFRNGLETLVDELFENLGEDRIRLNTRLKKVTKTGDTYQLHVNGVAGGGANGNVKEDASGDVILHADAVMLAVPHSHLPGMFSDEDLFSSFEQMPMSSVANVVLAFDESAVEQSLDGTGFVVSRNSEHRMTACTWTHRKWPTTTPEGKALLRVYVGKPSDQAIVTESDDELVRVVRAELEQTMGITDAPDFTMVTRWQNMMPQYTVGHVDRLHAVDKHLAELFASIHLAGSSFEGVGIPDCIKQGEDAARDILSELKES